MGPFNQNVFSKAPAMVLPPHGQQLPSPQLSASLDGATFDEQSTFAQGPPSPSSYANHSTTWTPTPSSAPISTNPSRKRSRDDSAFDAGADGSYFPSQSQQVATPAPIPEEEPIYGEGMVLINPSTGMSISAESQTGTWYEEKAEEQKHTRSQSSGDNENCHRPEMSLSRKSQRLDETAPPLTAGLDDIAQAALPASPPKTSASLEGPKVDDFTLALGIGWTQTGSGLGSEDNDRDVAAAARGWARYIENHFTDQVQAPVEVLAQSKGLNAYLVGCPVGFFLFRDDLSEGRFVAKDWESAIHELRGLSSATTGFGGQGGEMKATNGVDAPMAMVNEVANGEPSLLEQSLAAAAANGVNGANNGAAMGREHEGMDLD